MGAFVVGRRDLPFLLAFAAGVALRLVVTVAYRPALLFPDSFGYLHHAAPLHLSPIHPEGYAIWVWPMVHLLHSTAAIVVAQHVLGLAIAVAGYAFLARRGLPRWAAALATLPVLLDPLQLVLEQYVLSDVLFEALLVGAALVLLWRRRPGMVAAAVAGLLVAAATVTRGVGTVLAVGFLVALLWLRVPWPRLAAFVLALVLPIGAYMVVFHHEYGRTALETAGPRYLYARLAPMVRCGSVQLPGQERRLCPAGPVRDRLPIDWYMWHGRQSAQFHVRPPAGMTQVQLVRDFDRRVLRAQPVPYARSVAAQLVMGFDPSREAHLPGRPASRWLFHRDYWVLHLLIAHHLLPPDATAGASVDPAAAAFLAGYRTWLWTPGPLLAALLLAAVAAMLGLGRSRLSGDRVAVGLLATACLIPLLTASALNGFSWRYQLPQVPLLPLAGVLALAALLRGAAPDRGPQSLPRIRRRLVLVAGLASGIVVGTGLAVSGWASTGTAAVGGAVALIGATVLLVVSSTRSVRDAVRPRSPGRGGNAPPR